VRSYILLPSHLTSLRRQILPDLWSFLEAPRFCIDYPCKMNFDPFSFSNSFTNGDRPLYANGGADRLTSYTSNDRPSYSNHQSSHQEKLEAFRKSDAERDAFVQVKIYNVVVIVLHNPISNTTRSQSSKAMKSFKPNTNRSATTMRMRLSLVECGRLRLMQLLVLYRLSSTAL